jgi:hypothetical protein
MMRRGINNRLGGRWRRRRRIQLRNFDGKRFIDRNKRERFCDRGLLTFFVYSLSLIFESLL